MEFHYRDACTTKLYVLVATTGHGRVGLQVLSYEGAQDAVARAMQYAHARHAQQYGIVDVVGDSLQGLFATHTTHVDVLLEV